MHGSRSTTSDCMTISSRQLPTFYIWFSTEFPMNSFLWLDTDFCLISHRLSTDFWSLTSRLLISGVGRISAGIQTPIGSWWLDFGIVGIRSDVSWKSVGCVELIRIFTSARIRLEVEGRKEVSRRSKVIRNRTSTKSFNHTGMFLNCFKL